MKSTLSHLTLALTFFCSMGVFANEEALLGTHIGVLEYKGGLVSDLSINFKAAKAKNLQLKIPSFCRDLDVLEVAVLANGKSVPLELVDPAKQIYSINKGLGTLVDTLTATFNGPSSLECSIPVYLVDKTVAMLTEGTYYAVNPYCPGVGYIGSQFITPNYPTKGRIRVAAGEGFGYRVFSPASLPNEYLAQDPYGRLRMIVTSPTSYSFNSFPGCVHRFVRQ